jgi:hypothetical protein
MIAECHTLIGYNSSFEIDPFLTIDQFAVHINNLYNNCFERFKGTLKLTPPNKPFINETGEHPSGFDDSVEVIDESIQGICLILNQILQSTDFSSKKVAMDVLAKILTQLASIGYQLSRTNNETIQTKADYESMLRKLKVLTPRDIADYEIKTSQKLRLNFLQGYLPITQQGYSEAYTWTEGGIVRLPCYSTDDELVPMLIDKLLYEAMRHPWQQDPCLSLRRSLNKVYPGTFTWSKHDLEEFLSQKETTTKTYFGEFASEDSDSLEEAQYRQMSPLMQQQYSSESKTALARTRPKPSTYANKMKEISDPPSPNRKTTAKIHHAWNLNQTAIKNDLNIINERLRLGLPITDDFLNNLGTRFCVAQYRGIHYLRSLWDTSARRQHRALNEVNAPQFSSSVFIAAGVRSYREYIEKLQNSPEFSAQIETKAQELQKKLQALQHTPPVTYDGRAYVSPFHLLQYWYTSNYDQYSARVKLRLDVQDPIFFHYLFNENRPFLSTADLPLHALWYAYGIKLYQGHEHERLRPRWRKDGKAERPYSGKVYLSLHPLSDYSTLSPSHLTSLFKHGLITLDNFIAAERETSFLGYLPKDRVAYHYKAKYPSFKGPYKLIYESKYGIDSKMYKILQDNFNLYAPHSDERRKLIHLLGDYLSAFHEVRLIEKARSLAAAKGEILIYRNEDGLFSLNHPETPSTRVTALNSFIKAKRDLYLAIGTLNKSHQVKSIAEVSFITKINGHYKELSTNDPKTLRLLPDKKAELFRFFGSKNRGNASPANGPIAHIPLTTQNYIPA